MYKVIIIGTGGLAREVHQLLKDVNQVKSMANESYSFLGFLDDDVSKHGTEVHGEKVLGGIEWLENNQDVGVIVGIGSPEIKLKIVERIKNICDFRFPNIIHPNVIIGENVELGEGNIICAGNIITTDIKLENFTTLNLNCTIGHDSIIKNYATISPGTNVSGNVNVGEGVDLGTNSVIIQGRNIGEWSIVGAGAVVVKDIPPYTTSVGNPAKVIKERKHLS